MHIGSAKHYPTIKLGLDPTRTRYVLYVSPVKSGARALALHQAQTSNDDAVAYVATRNLASAVVDRLTRAFRVRNAGENVTPLFSDRAKLGNLLRLCTESIRATYAR